MDESDQLSYFQVAGIHGRPFILWNGVSQVPGSGWGGYCNHSKCRNHNSKLALLSHINDPASVLFLTWHRPYLALYEVSLLIAWTRLRRLTLSATSCQSCAGDCTDL
jgi:tyrosinase